MSGGVSTRWALLFALASLALAQTRPIGSVTAVDASERRITIRTDAGAEMLVLFDAETAFLRVAPGERDLTNASAIASSELAAGDRILARGTVAEDGKSVVARSVIVMAQADIARKQAADRAEWERRGIGGIVTAVNVEANELTISVPGLGEPTKVVVSPAGGAEFRRYAPDSVKFSDARPSRLDEIKAGDQVRALGDRSDDGSRFTAQELVSGSFLNIAATVDAVDAEAGSITVTNLADRKKLTVRITEDSSVKMLAPFAARMLAMRGAGGEQQAKRFAAGPRGQGGAPAGPRPMREGSGGPGAGMQEPLRDFQSMLEKMPAITLADLNPGDAIAIASTRGSDPARLTAITILAGIEPLVTSAPQDGRQAALGSWNLDLNMNMGLP